MNPLVDRYIDTLEEPHQKLVQQLRSTILALVPGVQEKLSFKIPFYHYYGMFCYINPVKDGVDLGICNGKKIAAAFPALEVKGRAIVATVRLRSPSDLEKMDVAAILATAAIDKETTAAAKKKKR